MKTVSCNQWDKYVKTTCAVTPGENLNMVNVDFDWLVHLSACNVDTNFEKVLYTYIMAKMDMQPPAFYNDIFNVC